MKELEKFFDLFKGIENIGSKTAEKIVLNLIKNKEKRESILSGIKKIESDLDICSICFFITINNICEYCKEDSIYDKKLICVVSNLENVISISSKNFYKGLFHVLGGEININKNITPDKLKIEELFARINKGEELIIALNSTFEGEVTANYISKLAEKKGIKTSRLARGIPLGGVIDYIDEGTLQDAFINRKKF